MIHQVLKMAADTITVQELMGYMNLSYKAAYYHLSTAHMKGYLDKTDSGYVITLAGREELRSVILPVGPSATVAEIPDKYQLCVLSSLNQEQVKILETTTKEEALAWIQEHGAYVVRATLFTAILADDLTQINKLPRDNK